MFALCAGPGATRLENQQLATGERPGRGSTGMGAQVIDQPPIEVPKPILCAHRLNKQPDWRVSDSSASRRGIGSDRRGFGSEVEAQAVIGQPDEQVTQLPGRQMGFACQFGAEGRDMRAVG